jgi:NTP pyrophosphatase (non-canonical NTP hydrolase)
MTLEQLLSFIDKENIRLQKKYGVTDPVIRLLGRMAKLTEEVGELSSEVLAFNSFQRQTKLNKHSLKSISHEVADVLITTLLLAKTMDIDIKQALKEKIAKIEKRHIHNP